MNPHLKFALSFAGRFVTAGLLAILAYLLVLAAWGYLEKPVNPPEWDGQFAGVTYSGYRPGEGPHEHRYPTEAEVRADLSQLSGYTRKIRTYTATEGPAIAPIAEDFGLDVMAGSWLSGNTKHDDAEIAALVKEAKASPAITSVLVGNEVLLRKDLTEAEMARYLDRVRKKTKKPVSTTEPWNIWMDHPDLAKHVDFIAVHILPYWEKMPVDQAVNFTFARLDDLHRTFPGKRIVLAETGWPTHGESKGQAIASEKNQSVYLREFMSRAKDENLDYYVIEAYDQQWKKAEEGRPGMYWGLFDASRHLKFVGKGPVFDDTTFPKWGPVSMLWFVLPVLAFCTVFAYLRASVKMMLSMTLYATGAYLAWYSRAFQGMYDVSPATMHWVLLPVTVLCLAVILVQIFEAGYIMGAPRLKRAFDYRPLPTGRPEPVVSLHLACANEPSEMVIATLESLKRLQYSNFEVLVVDNNTKDESLWRPVEKWVNENPEHFRFWHLPSCPGFKAEALNHALKHTRGDAEVVGVIDADYIVNPDWLEQLMGHFEDENVALVQSPQAHRDFEDNRLSRWAAYEFDGFFRLGMHYRNEAERGAIIQHGTMTLVRARALIRVGGWAQWTICEDAELGLRLLEEGYEARYIDRVTGRGLAPATFASFRSQRRRWALGAMQILKGHAGQLFGRSRLTIAQRFHFVAGWLPWLSEGLQLVGTTLSLIWTVGMMLAPKTVQPPIASMLTLVFVVPLFRLLMGMTVFRMRVGCSWRDAAGAALASMAVIYATAEGVLAGLLGKRATFIVTAKGKQDGRQSLFTAVKRETVLTAGLWTGALMTYLSYEHGHAEPVMWTIALLLLSLPYATTLLVTWLTAPKTVRVLTGQAIGHWTNSQVNLLSRDTVQPIRRVSQSNNIDMG